MLKVCKFGGTSMADGYAIRKVKDILDSDTSRRYIVVSAPGKRFSNDSKITDVLYSCQTEREVTGSAADCFYIVRKRFKRIAAGLNLSFDIDDVLDKTLERIDSENNEEFTVSRGEYLAARLAAEYFGARFVDAEDVIFFNSDGSLDAERSYKAIAEAVKGATRVVIPGFYGMGAYGKVKTFSRGGSDISGAIVARAVNATVYENWTDVSGFLACDPRIVDNPKVIKTLSYKELRELSYMGANVLHSESIFPVRKANIPIQIKNTFRPEDAGTEIVPTSRFVLDGRTVTGIAGRKNFTVIFVEKSLMNSEIGFIRKLLTVFEKEGISVEHVPSGIDTVSVVVDSENLADYRLDTVLKEIEAAVNPDNLRVLRNIALIATVGHGMSSSVGTSARLFNAIAAANINIKMIDQGSSELNIVVGVNNDDYERCIQAIYSEFFSY